MPKDNGYNANTMHARHETPEVGSGAIKQSQSQMAEAERGQDTDGQPDNNNNSNDEYNNDNVDKRHK